MRWAEYVLTGWGASVAALGAYVVWVMRRGRRLSADVPADERRWSGS
jgi:hypothetical protein